MAPVTRGGRVVAASAALALVVAALAVWLVGGTGEPAAAPLPQAHDRSSAGPSSPAPPTAPPSPAGPASRRPSPPPLLLPNLRSLAAHDLEVEDTGDGRLLRFSASLANFGPGPLVLRPRGGKGCPRGRHPAVQVLFVDRNGDGAYQRGRDRAIDQNPVGCMLAHPDHDHWHFAAMARYTLRDARSGAVLAARNKVSFCLRDNERVPGGRVTAAKEYFGECSRRTRQGISPGWVDVYTADLAGQTLPVPPRADGRLLCLELEADPLRSLSETDEGDNASSIAIRIDGSLVRRVAARGCG